MRVAWIGFQVSLSASALAFLYAWSVRFPLAGDGSGFFLWGLATYGASLFSLAISLALVSNLRQLMRSPLRFVLLATAAIQLAFTAFGTWTLASIVIEGKL